LVGQQLPPAVSLNGVNMNGTRAITQRAAKCEAEFAKPGTLGRNIKRRSGLWIYANDRQNGQRVTTDYVCLGLGCTGQLNADRFGQTINHMIGL
jgi:hypothetical protein